MDEVSQHNLRSRKQPLNPTTKRNNNTSKIANNTKSSANTKIAVTTPSTSTTVTTTSTSAPKRISTINSKVSSTSRLSVCKISPVDNKLTLLEARLAAAEAIINPSNDKILALEARISAAEGAFNQLKSENSELHKTIAKLVADNESLQMVTATLCNPETNFNESEDCKQLKTENINLRNTLSGLRVDLTNFKDQVDRLNRANNSTFTGISLDQE